MIIMSLVVLVGRFKMARKDLEKCLELNPLFTDAKLNLDQVMKDLQQIDSDVKS